MNFQIMSRIFEKVDRKVSIDLFCVPSNLDKWSKLFGLKNLALEIFQVLKKNNQTHEQKVRHPVIMNYMIYINCTFFYSIYITFLQNFSFLMCTVCPE